MHRLAVRFTWGFSAIDLLICFAVTSVCVVLASPMLSDFSVRAKVTEALVVAESASRDLTITCAENPAGGILDFNNAGIKLDQSHYVKSVVVQGSCAQPAITVETMNTGATIDLALLLSGESTPGGTRMTWTCSSNGPDSYVPDSCR